MKFRNKLILGIMFIGVFFARMAKVNAEPSDRRTIYCAMEERGRFAQFKDEGGKILLILNMIGPFTNGDDVRGKVGIWQGNYFFVIPILNSDGGVAYAVEEVDPESELYENIRRGWSNILRDQRILDVQGVLFYEMTKGF